MLGALKEDFARDTCSLVSGEITELLHALNMREAVASEPPRLGDPLTFAGSAWQLPSTIKHSQKAES